MKFYIQKDIIYGDSPITTLLYKVFCRWEMGTHLHTPRPRKLALSIALEKEVSRARKAEMYHDALNNRRTVCVAILKTRKERIKSVLL